MTPTPANAPDPTDAPGDPPRSLVAGAAAADAAIALAPANLGGLAVGAVILLSLAALGGTLSMLFTSFLDAGASAAYLVGDAESAAPTPPVDGRLEPIAAGSRATFSAAVYMPPRPQEAPPPLRDAVMLGLRLMNETRELLPANVGNSLSCSSCHFGGGISEGGRTGGLSLVGVAAKYPIFRSRAEHAVDLATRTNSCFERSMNGAPLDPSSAEMTAILTYFAWISRGVPIYAEIPWLGIRPLESDRRGDEAAGARVYAERCAACHAADGAGTLLAPPLWGAHSFNDGAGMHTPETFAAFTWLNMPKGNPGLTPAQAIDVAAFVTSRPRPHFRGHPIGRAEDLDAADDRSSPRADAPR